MDLIRISSLQARGVLGVGEEERRERQDILIDLELELDLSPAGRSDLIQDTMDYRLLKKDVLALVETSEFHLAEALAEAVASVCLAREMVRRVRVRVEKPTALRFARSVGVEIERSRVQPERAFISVASNQQPAEHIAKALRALNQAEPIVGLSSFYLTPAEDRPEQDNYYNGVVELKTRTSPWVLKHLVLRSIERKLGRRRSDDKFAPRVIDLDLLVHGSLKASGPDLTLPDPQILTRTYVAASLRELAPDLLLPGWGLTASDIAVRLGHADLQVLQSFTDSIRKEILHAAESR